MIEENNGKIKIYSQINRGLLKQGLTIVVIAEIFLIILCVITPNNALRIFWGFFIIIGLIPILFSVYMLKNRKDKKLKIVLCTEYLEIYGKKENEKILLKDILSATFDPSDNLNQVYLNYKNEKNKNKTKVIIAQGCSNIKLANYINELIEGNKEKPKENQFDNNKSENIKIENFEANMIKGNALMSGDVFYGCFIGKSKILTERGNSLPQVPSTFLFVCKDGKFIKLWFTELAIKPEELEVNCNYKIQFNKKNRLFNIEKVDSEVIYPFLESIKKMLSIKLIYTFDNKRIIKEISMEREYNIFRKIILLWFLISILFLFINVLIGGVLFIALLFIFPIYLIKFKKRFLYNIDKE